VILNKKMIEAEKQVAILTNQSNRLENNLQQAEDKIEILRQEKLFLAQEKSELQGYLKQLERVS
jgi:phage shock protein A